MLKVNCMKRLSKEITGHEIRIFLMVPMTCRSLLIHIEVYSKLQPLLYQEHLLILSRLESMNLSKP
jgi:hypothetical protein